jgi:hypothetical protein
MQRQPARRGSPSPYLWCHPLWCTSLSSAAEEGLLPCPAEPKVCDLHTPAVVQQDVGGLEVLQGHRAGHDFWGGVKVTCTHARHNQGVIAHQHKAPTMRQTATTRRNHTR